MASRLRLTHGRGWVPGACALVLVGCGGVVTDREAGTDDADVVGYDAREAAFDAPGDAPDVVVALDAGDASTPPADVAADAAPLAVTIAPVTLYPGTSSEQTVDLRSAPAGATFALVPGASSTGLVGHVTNVPGGTQYVLTLAAAATAPLATSVVALQVTAGGTVQTATFPVHVTAAPNLDDLMSLMGGFTASTHTPLGVHYEAAAARTYTAAQLAPLGLATSQPVIPPSTSGLHVTTFHVELYPHGRPNPADVVQHAIGDCDGDAALAGMAYSAPAFVESLIHDHGDGTFDVAMYDPQGHPLTVRVNSTFLADSSGQLAAASGEGGVADWATVLEKAAMKYNGVFHIVADIGGIGSEFLTPMFTGTGVSYSFDRGVLSPAQLQRVVTVALETGHFVTGGFGIVKRLGAVETVVAHAYTVMVPEGAGIMAIMRNPWGTSPLPTAGMYDGSHDGVLDIPATADWATTIDLRIIDPGHAGAWVQTTPFHYVPSGATHIDYVTEPHAPAH